MFIRKKLFSIFLSNLNYIFFLSEAKQNNEMFYLKLDFKRLEIVELMA